MQIIKGNKLHNNEENSGVVLNIAYKNYDKTVHKEILVYDGPGLIYQLGGVISLFLGISFYTLLSNMLDWVGRKL